MPSTLRTVPARRLLTPLSHKHRPLCDERCSDTIRFNVWAERRRFSLFFGAVAQRLIESKVFLSRRVLRILDRDAKGRL